MKRLLTGIGERKALSSPFIIILFLLVNALISGLAFMIWQRPQYESFISARAIVQLLERRYAIDRLHADVYSDNLLRLEALAAREDPVLPYEYLVEVLAQMRDLSDDLGLREIDFFAGEPIGIDFIAQTEIRIVALRATVVYEGSFDALSSFVQGMADGPGSITSLHLEWLNAAGHIRLRAEITFFGVEPV